MSSSEGAGERAGGAWGGAGPRGGGVARRRLGGEGGAGVASGGGGGRTWFGLPCLAVCLTAAATTLVLAGSDIAIVAGMRQFDATPQIGVVLALWGLGSLVGGLAYGALQRSIAAFWLLTVPRLVPVPR